MLGAVDDLDDAPLIEDAVFGVARSFGAQQGPVAYARRLAWASAARRMQANLGWLAVGFLVPFGRYGDELAVSVAGGNVGKHDFRQCAGAVQLLADRLQPLVQRVGLDGELLELDRTSTLGEPRGAPRRVCIIGPCDAERAAQHEQTPRAPYTHRVSHREHPFTCEHKRSSARQG